MTLPVDPTPLEWCATCDRYVRPTGHLDFHEGRTLDEARSPEALLLLRRTISIPPTKRPASSGVIAFQRRNSPVWVNQPKQVAS
jgi:hypothetical protein